MYFARLNNMNESKVRRVEIEIKNYGFNFKCVLKYIVTVFWY